MHPVDLIAHQVVGCLNPNCILPYRSLNIITLSLCGSLKRLLQSDTGPNRLGRDTITSQERVIFLKVSLDKQHPGIGITTRTGFHK